MSTIKATPEELRRLASALRQSGSHLHQLGDQAIAAAASANAPAAIGTMGEAASFAAGARVTEFQTGIAAADTERVAALFEAADRGAGWFSRASLAVTGGWERVGLWAYGTMTGLHKLWSRTPHNLSRSAWSTWQRQLTDARTEVGRYWGDRGVTNTIKAWTNAQVKMLMNPRATAVKFVNQGVRAVKALSTNAALKRGIKPLAELGGKVAGRVLKPLMVVQAYHDSKARSPLGKGVSAVVSTALTVHPVGFVLDLVTGGQVTKGADGVVNTIASVGDSERLSEMSAANARGENGLLMQGIQATGDEAAGAIWGIGSTIDAVGDSERLSELAAANAKGENGLLMKGIQATGDGLADGIYNGWTWVSNGH